MAKVLVIVLTLLGSIFVLVASAPAVAQEGGPGVGKSGSPGTGPGMPPGAPGGMNMPGKAGAGMQGGPMAGTPPPNKGQLSPESIEMTGTTPIVILAVVICVIAIVAALALRKQTPSPPH